MLQHTFKPEHTRTDKGSMKHDLALFKDGISMSTNLVILGRPPGRALFNVKSRTLRVLTTTFRGTHIPPPHLEFGKLQVYRVHISLVIVLPSTHIEVL